LKKVAFKNIFKKNKFSFLSQGAKKKVVVIGAVLICILFIVLIAVIMTNQVNFDKAKALILEKGMISIGLRTDMDGLARKNDSEVIEGFEADLAAEIVKRLFPDGSIKVQYKEVNSKTGKVFIDTGELDITLAAYVPGSDVDYILYSEAYYTDSIVFYAKKGGAEGIDQLKGKKIGVVSTSYAGQKLEAYFKEKNIDCKIVQFSSYPDAADALGFGNVDVFAGSSVLMRSYTAGSALLTGNVLPHGYCIAMKKSNVELKKALDYILNELKKDGTLSLLEQKWQLPGYSK